MSTSAGSTSAASLAGVTRFVSSSFTLVSMVTGLFVSLDDNEVLTSL